MYTRIPTRSGKLGSPVKVLTVIPVNTIEEKDPHGHYMIELQMVAAELDMKLDPKL